MKNIFISIILILGIWIHAGASEKYNIRINIQNCQDSVLLLTTYYGDKILLVDTAYADKPGSFLFKGDSLLPGGIYMAVSEKKLKLFEFIVNGKQQFSLNTDTIAYTLNMRVKGSPENKLFFGYMKYNEEQFSKSRSLVDSIKGVEAGTPEHEKLKHQIDSVKHLTVEYKLNIINTKSELFISKLFNAMRDIEIPDSVKNSSDGAATYRYYKDHFWDFVDLSDARLLHTPLLNKKVNQYFSQLVILHPDSVIAAIDEVVSLARPSKEVVSWLVWHFVSEYQNPDYMGFDVVFIHIADEYFQKEEILNATASVTQNILDRANKLRPLVLGNPAPNLILIDTTGDFKSFHVMKNDYVILFFWDFDCGICKNEIEELKNIVLNKDIDVGVFAINVNGDLKKWKSSIIEQNFTWMNVNATQSITNDYHDLYDVQGTPALFILDPDRYIIAKRLSANQVLMFLDNYEKGMNSSND